MQIRVGRFYFSFGVIHNVCMLKRERGKKEKSILTSMGEGGGSVVSLRTP